MEAGAVNSAQGRWWTSGTRPRRPQEPDTRVARIAAGRGRRGREAPAPTRAAVRPRIPGVASVHLLLRGPGPVHRLLLVRLQAGSSSARSRRISCPSTDTGSAFSGTFRTVFSGTLQISIVGTLLCLLIGFPFAYWLAVKVPPRWRGLLLGLVIVPFWTNFLVRTLGWLILLQPNGPAVGAAAGPAAIGGPLDVLDTREAVQLGVVYNYLPLMIFPLFVALDRLDPALREASKDLGAGRWKTFRQVTLPLAMPGVVVRPAARLHPTHRRLHHGGRPGRREGEHGRRPRGEPVQHRPELGARLGDGGHPDPDDPRHRSRSSRRSGWSYVRSSVAGDGSRSWRSRHERRRHEACAGAPRPAGSPSRRLGRPGVRLPVPADPDDRRSTPSTTAARSSSGRSSA